MIRAYAAHSAGEALQAFEYQPDALRDDEVEIQVEHCGICHSDLSMIDNEWGRSSYPLVPGHEVVGRISALGSNVRHLQRDQRVGLGWHAGYCLHCNQCHRGDHNLCQEAKGTIINHHGGFAERVRAQATSIVPLPESLDAASAGPLFCGGITVFTPFLDYGISPTAKVGVIGIGGLGHLALQFARAWGCEVTAFTSSSAKADEAKSLGAHHTINSRDKAALEQAAGKFDLLISTVNVKLDWNRYLNTLGPRGRLHFVGATLEPLDIGAFNLIGAQREVSGSPVGSPSAIATMLEFAARHQITARVEHFPMSQVNDALQQLREGKAHYRIVLDADWN